MFRFTMYLLVAATSMTAMGQVPKVETPIEKATKFPDDELSFANVMVAKVSADGTKVSLLAPSFREVTRTREVTIPRLIPEKRTRVVTDPNGKKTEETYEVMVPVSQKVPQTYTTKFIIGMKRHEVKIEGVRAWRTDGGPLDAKALAEALKDSKPVFVAEVLPSTEFAAVDPFYAAILKKDSIVIYLNKFVLANSIVEETPN